MKLISWRHAETEVGEPDIGRALTGKGHKQAWKIVDWLDHNLPNSYKIISSPVTSTVQIAEALGRKFKTHPDLGSDCSAQQLLTVANWSLSREPVLII